MSRGGGRHRYVYLDVYTIGNTHDQEIEEAVGREADASGMSVDGTRDLSFTFSQRVAAERAEKRVIALPFVDETRVHAENER
jgi:hypothetical protein